jgi:orotate phosphoribosyltransferase
MRVVLLEDVVTTGASVHEAFERVTELGVEVVAAVTLVDRGDQADAFFASRGVPYLALLTYRDLGIERVGPAATQ